MHRIVFEEDRCHQKDTIDKTFSNEYKSITVLSEEDIDNGFLCLCSVDSDMFLIPQKYRNTWREDEKFRPMRPYLKPNNYKVGYY